jgi:hypothetical protein
MKVLALDLATNVGFASGEPGGEPTFGSHKLKSTGDDIGSFAHEFDLLASRLFSEIEPSLVVFCSPILPPATKIQTLRKLQGLAWHTEYVAKRFRIECREIYEAQARSFFLGKGARTLHLPGGEKITLKQQAFDRCRQIGWMVVNNDESDACAAWAFTCARLAPAAGLRHGAGPVAAGTARWLALIGSSH